MAAFAYPPVTTLECPIVRQNHSHHVHLDNERFDNLEIEPSPYSIPKVGRLCYFTSGNLQGGRNTFLGRIIRTIQWQRSQAIVRVEHDNGLASFALALPHHRVYQGWTLRVIQFFARWLPEDSEELAQGISIDPDRRFWELDDEYQQKFYLEVPPSIEIVITTESPSAP